MNDIQPVKSNHYRKIWIGAILFFFIVGAGWLAYWFIWGQFKEKTNDAYVNGNMIIIKPFEEGIVVSILADNAQMVEKGQPLVELNRHDFEIALEKTKADLADAVRDVVQMFLKTEELNSKIKVFEAKVARARLDYEHRADLVADGSVSREDFEHSESDLAAAIAALAETEKEWAEAVAEIQNTTPFTHPRVEMAKAAVKTSLFSSSQVYGPGAGIGDHHAAKSSSGAVGGSGRAFNGARSPRRDLGRCQFSRNGAETYPDRPAGRTHCRYVWP